METNLAAPSDLTQPGRTVTPETDDRTAINTDNTDNMAPVATMTALSPLQTSNMSSSNFHMQPPSPSTLSAKRSRSPLSIDLGSVPALSSPAPPTNTLLITRLEDSKVFHPASIATIREHLTSIAPLNSFSPLKSMARIIVSFYNEDDCIRVRQEIDGSAFTPKAVAKCYFGEPTPIDAANEKKYLERPDAGKLFFISPPPSPPVGWESKMEDPPNKEVHADDLMAKLANLTGRMEASDPDSPVEAQLQVTREELAKLKTTQHRRVLSGVAEDSSPVESTPRGRSRSSTLIYDPVKHGDSPNLPAVMLETEDDSDVELDGNQRQPMAHTARPPVELMEQ